MDNGAIICIRDRYYIQAAHLMLKSIMPEKYLKLSQLKSKNIRTRVAIRIRDKHVALKDWYAGMGIKPRIIAEQVYDEVMQELMRPISADYRSLSEIENDE